MDEHDAVFRTLYPFIITRHTSEVVTRLIDYLLEALQVVLHGLISPFLLLSVYLTPHP